MRGQRAFNAHGRARGRDLQIAGSGQQEAYRKCKWIAEPPNGLIKSVLGFRQFSMRGLHRVTAQWKLVCAALNLRRMCSLQPSAAPA